MAINIAFLEQLHKQCVAFSSLFGFNCPREFVHSVRWLCRKCQVCFYFFWVHYCLGYHVFSEWPWGRVCPLHLTFSTMQAAGYDLLMSTNEQKLTPILRACLTVPHLFGPEYLPCTAEGTMKVVDSHAERPSMCVLCACSAFTVSCKKSSLILSPYIC